MKGKTAVTLIYSSIQRLMVPLLAAALLAFTAQAASIPENFLTGDMAAMDVAPPVVDTSRIVFLDQDGQEQTLAAYQGSVVVMNLWATWCAPCRKEMPDLNNLQKMYDGKGLTVLALNEDRTQPQRALDFLAEIGATDLTFYKDKNRSAMLALGVRGLPATVIFDQNGQQVARLMGPAKWDGPHATAIFEYLLARQP